jgi:hypothetical protein
MARNVTISTATIGRRRGFSWSRGSRTLTLVRRNVATLAGWRRSFITGFSLGFIGGPLGGQALSPAWSSGSARSNIEARSNSLGRLGGLCTLRTLYTLYTLYTLWASKFGGRTSSASGAASFSFFFTLFLASGDFIEFLSLFLPLGLSFGHGSSLLLLLGDTLLLLTLCTFFLFLSETLLLFAFGLLTASTLLDFLDTLLLLCFKFTLSSLVASLELLVALLIKAITEFGELWDKTA